MHVNNTCKLHASVLHLYLRYVRKSVRLFHLYHRPQDMHTNMFWIILCIKDTLPRTGKIIVIAAIVADICSAHPITDITWKVIHMDIVPCRLQSDHFHMTLLRCEAVLSGAKAQTEQGDVVIWIMREPQRTPESFMKFLQNHPSEEQQFCEI